MKTGKIVLLSAAMMAMFGCEKSSTDTATPEEAAPAAEMPAEAPAEEAAGEEPGEGEAEGEEAAPEG